MRGADRQAYAVYQATIDRLTAERDRKGELSDADARSLAIVEKRMALFPREETRVQTVADPYDDPFYRDDAPPKPKPYGNVKYADPKNGKYPLDTKKRVKAAWAFINEAANAAKYPLNGVTLSDVKNNIIAAAKSFGIQIAADSGDGRSVLMAFDHDDPNRPLTADEVRELMTRHDAKRIRNHERHKREMQEAGDIPGVSYAERAAMTRRVHAAAPLDERSAREREYARWNGDRGKRGW